ncbi:MAG TPA: anthrone oxygenase family protein [Sphingomonas sp.]|nr:anthrone oxygenase family protein [Sphingomonas sp.]
MIGLLKLPVLIAAVGAFVIGGVFYGFSTFVMQALARLPVPEGIRAMQAINVTVINPLFLGIFIGTALLLCGLGIVAILNPGQPGAIYVIAGAALYVLGCFAVTMVCNVPLNNAIAAADPASADGAAVWARYLRDWVFWNHVRTAASLAGAVVLVLGWSQSR